MGSLPSGPPVTVLFLNGTVGAGKTATAFGVGELLRERGIAHQVIDVDELRRVWPAPPDDPFNSVLERANLDAMMRNALERGVRAFVLAGVIEDADGRAAYERLLARMDVVRFTVVRLTIEPEAVRRRLMHRHEPGPERDWHLARAGELARIIARADIDDRVVDTTARSIADVAADAAAGWIDEAVDRLDAPLQAGVSGHSRRTEQG